MKTIKLSFLLLAFIVTKLHAQEVTEGTYMPLYSYYNYNVKVDNGQILIEPCQKYDHQNSIDRETFLFDKISGSDTYGWKGSAQVPIEIKDNMLSFNDPYELSKPMPMMLIHPQNKLPEEGVLTYFDETQGGYSTARIRITDKEQIKKGSCFIHSKKIIDYNGDITGSFEDDYDSFMKLNLKSDFTGTYLGHQITWSVVTDYAGKVKKWEYPDDGYFLHIIMEFTSSYPDFIDPPSAGSPVGVIEGVRVSKMDGIFIGRMKKK